MDVVATWVRASGTEEAVGWSGRGFLALGVLALSLALLALPPAVAVLALLGLIS